MSGPKFPAFPSATGTTFPSVPSVPVPNESELLKAPWRDLGEDPWSKQTREQLKNEIATHDITNAAGIEYINVLFVGEVGAGKSSFFNNIESVFDGHVTSRANAGSLEKSLTTQYRQYCVCSGAQDSEEKDIKFRFCDSMGLEGDAGLTAPDMERIMDGHVEDLAELSSAKFMPGAQGYRTNPTMNDRIHCVVFVMNAMTVSSMDDTLVAKIKEIRAKADDRHLYPMIILTRIDALCEETEDKTSNVFLSTAVRDKVKEVGETFGVKPNNIHPVRNYESQTECQVEIDILTLRALRQILRYSKSYLKDEKQRRKAENKMLEDKWAEYKNKDKTSAESTKKLQKKGKGDEKPEDIDKAPPLPEDEAPPPPSTTVKTCTARYPYAARGSNQLNMTKDEKFTVLEENLPGGWTRVRNIAGQEGKIPTNYVEINETTTAPDPAPAPPAPATSRTAAYAYTATTPGSDVSMAQGEKVTVVGENQGWSEVVKANGEKGFVPTSFLN